MKKIIAVVGARPNFMKVSPIHKVIQKLNTQNSSLITNKICHTGQHYDEKMSRIFFDELELPQPDYYLGVGSGSHAEQTARIMIEFEKVLLYEKPDLIIVVGDVNSTIACTLTAVKLYIKVAHIEAGLRSFDRKMPEEINRILTDSISDYLFVTERRGIENLKREGISEDKIFFTGNVMIDSLLYYYPKVEKSNILKSYNLLPQNGDPKPIPYILVTLHRPGNVDSETNLHNIAGLLNSLGEKTKIIFPVHPRTKKNLINFNLLKILNPNIIFTEPLGYVDFIALIKNCRLVLTDSGGIQEETTFLGIPCVTLRTTTERPVTVELGTNYLVGDDTNAARKVCLDILDNKFKKGQIPELWDGKSAERIVSILLNMINN